MFVGQVSEHGHVVGDLSHAVERQSVRGRLDDGGAVAGPHHRSEHQLELRRLGGRHVLRVRRLQEPHLQCRRRDEAGRDAGGLEDRRRQKRGRGLAVRAGHAHDAQVPAGVAVPPGGRGGERQARVGDDDLGQAGSRNRPFHHDRRRSERGGRGHEVVPVGMDARDRYKDGVGADTARVRGQTPDLDRLDSLRRPAGAGRRVPRRDDAPQLTRRLEPRYQLTQRTWLGGLCGSQYLGHCIGRVPRRLVRVPSNPAIGACHSEFSPPGGCCRPRTLRMPWRQAPIRSCMTWALS